MNVKIDLREFDKALTKAIATSSRSASEVINAACLDIIIRSAGAIKKADEGKIRKQLQDTVSVVSKKTGKETSRRHPSRLVYNIINARLAKKGSVGLSGQKMAAAAKKLISARVSSIGYIAYAGFQKANLAFGGRGFGRNQNKQLNEKSKAARGYGIAAEPRALYAQFVNAATAAFEVGGAAVQAIVDWKAQDIKRHLEEKFKKEFSKI